LTRLTGQPQRQHAQALHKQLNLPSGTADVIPVEMARWKRIKRRVEGLDERWILNLLAAGASAALSFAVSAFITALAIPTGKKSSIDPAVRPGLFIGAAAAALIAILLLGFFLIQRKERRQERSDIVDEMEAEEEAWAPTAPAARGSSG
jgi:hypothetical protein